MIFARGWNTPEGATWFAVLCVGGLIVAFVVRWWWER